jgi:hypothetical protein
MFGNEAKVYRESGRLMVDCWEGPCASNGSLNQESYNPYGRPHSGGGCVYSLGITFRSSRRSSQSVMNHERLKSQRYCKMQEGC